MVDCNLQAVKGFCYRGCCRVRKDLVGQVADLLQNRSIATKRLDFPDLQLSLVVGQVIKRDERQLNFGGAYTRPYGDACRFPLHGNSPAPKIHL